MNFQEKLTLLMHIQDVPNNKLAKALSVDPSLVSRWRSGKRNLPQNSGYLMDIARYFSYHCQDLACLCEVLDIPYDQAVSSREKLLKSLYKWLSDEKSPSIDLANRFIAQLNESKTPKLPPFNPEQLNRYSSSMRLSVDAYRGNEGKRLAVLRFLETVIACKKKSTLLLYSDEPMDWIVEDSNFSLLWAQLLVEVIKVGHRIVIIHTVTRNIKELLMAIDRWMPLYLSGSIEPYYYPGYSESIFKRSLFVAPGIAAISSNTISPSETSEQLFHEDPAMLKVLEDEFNTYLKVCRPLMQIFTQSSYDAFMMLLDELESQKGDVVYFSKLPSLLCLSHMHLKDYLTHSLLTQSVIDQIMDTHQKRTQLFLSNLESHKHCEWLELPLPSDFLHSETRSIFKSEPIFQITDFYTRDLFIDHIEDTLYLLKNNKHFHLHLSTGQIPEGINIVVKRDIGVIISKTYNTDSLFFVFNHPMLVMAFEAFVMNQSDCDINEQQNKAKVISTLETWLESVKYEMPKSHL